MHYESTIEWIKPYINLCYLGLQNCWGGGLKKGTSMLSFDYLGLTWLLMDERRCGVISMVDASDCRGGVAVSMCSLEAVAVEKIISYADNIVLLQGFVNLSVMCL